MRPGEAAQRKMAKILDTKSLQHTESVAASSPSLIPDQKLIAIYTLMLRCRLLQQRAAALFQQGRLNTDLHASIGREACAVAVGVDLEPEDTLSITSGDWLAALVKGLPAETLFRVLAPRANAHSTSVAEEAEKRNILVHDSSTDQPSIVRDRAEALHAAKRPLIVAAFLPPITESADNPPNHWLKVISAAAQKKLPIVFVRTVTDDRPEKTPSTRNRSKTPQALLHGVPSISVDAADPVALYRVAFEAITRARQGRGATLLECLAIPVTPPANPATDQPVQPPDPVSIMEAYLKRKGIQPEPFSRQVVAEFSHDLDLATRFLLL